MDIKHLQYVIEVARTGSFTKAAQTMFVSQPTISKMIKSVEEELGVELFDRSGPRIVPTDVGQLIVDQANVITHAFGNLTAGLDDLATLRRGKLRIGLPPMAGAGYFAEPIGRFHAKYPGIAIELAEDGAKRIESDIESGALDFGVVLLPTKSELFESILIADERLMLLVHPEHRYAARTDVRLNELAAESFISFSEGFALHDRIPAACLAEGFQPNVVCESSQWDLIVRLVAANLGVALLPETICKEAGSGVAAIALESPIIPWQLAFVWRKDRYLSYAAKEWIRYLGTVFPGGQSSK
ncbi:LysR family transcriptional regulator [Paenibacillus cellulosilyticus]|uniref:LysR family transcriptional regulator n=1 Tax=Paenibacillus cellulosilyticus TaxID=375489 RepID=UPI00158009F6|nr:LysR family transcriptional regulator [Paenibacillus cellulosilyticus]